LKRLTTAEVEFAKSSVVDDAGKVFFYQGRVFRAIYSAAHAGLYREILQREWIDEIFACGLVKTTLCEELSLEGASAILEHEAIPFETHPAEHTSYMHWLTAKAIVRVNLALARHGLLLKDAHPWNVMFCRGVATVIDFGSIVKSATVPSGCLEEFRRYFCAPIWLASTRWHGYAREYRRQHGNGFGLQLFDSRWLNRLALNAVLSLDKHLCSPSEFFKRLNDWLDRHQPVAVAEERWANYSQCGAEKARGQTDNVKENFVVEILKKERPATVLDFAANKGHYSRIAATLGSAVVACDYEEYCVDQCLQLAQEKRLPITPALMDFCRPTPGYGVGLCGRDSYERFRSEIVLALGLVHHICIAQEIPVRLFCDICMNYATKGILLEYVDPADRHVASWGRPTPAGYSIEGLAECFQSKFPRLSRSDTISHDGLSRVMIYFSL